MKKQTEEAARRAQLALYMCRIDHAYKTAKHDAEKNLKVLRQEIKDRPHRFDNEWRNLSSWANDLKEAQKRKEELAALEADQLPQQMKIDDERRKAIEELIVRY